MSKFRDLVIDIQEDIEAGVLSFSQIALKREVPYSWVEQIAQEMLEQEQYVMENDYMDDY